MIEAMDLYDIRFPPGGAQNIPSSAQTPYLIPITRQISLCTKRGFKRLLNELSVPLSALCGNLVVSIILGTMFYNLSGNTSSFFGRGVLLFITILLNTSLAAFEVSNLFLVTSAEALLNYTERRSMGNPSNFGEAFPVRILPSLRGSNRVNDLRSPQQTASCPRVQPSRLLPCQSSQDPRCFLYILSLRLCCASQRLNDLSIHGRHVAHA
jgi:hypothetical protein